MSRKLDMLLCLAIPLLFLAAGFIVVMIEPTTPNKMSPCQCKMAGGCVVEWSMRSTETYADGTAPRDYDAWGRYTGRVDVPRECR